MIYFRLYCVGFIVAESRGSAYCIFQLINAHVTAALNRQQEK
jgi:hypothetical protein